MPDAKPQPLGSPRNYYSLVIIVLLGLAIYANAVNRIFIWDDKPLVLENADIRDWSSLPRLFVQDIGAGSGRTWGSYRPLQIFTYMVDYSLWKLDARGYHFVNVLLHIMCALGVYRLIMLMFGQERLAFLTAVLFVVHPAHTEAVTYIAGRADSLALFFMLLTFIYYLKFEHAKSAWRVVVITFFYACALASRENSLILPGLILVYHLYCNKKIPRRTFTALVAIAAVYVVFRLTVLRGFMPEPLPVTFAQRLPGVFAALAGYVGLIVAPFNLHMEYGMPLMAWTDPQVLMGMVVLAGLVLLVFYRPQRNMLVKFGVVWFLVALLPVSNLYPVNAYMAEHWLYVPSIGIFLVMAHVVSTLWNTVAWRVPVAAVVLGFIVFLAVTTVKQNSLWADPVRFYERTIQLSPYSPRAYSNLGSEYLAGQDYAKAAEAFQKAIALDPQTAEAYNNLGAVYELQGRNTEALEYYLKAGRLKENYADAYFNVGRMYMSSGNMEGALEVYAKVIAIRPGFPQAYNNLGHVYNAMGQRQTAINQFQKAVTFDPAYGEAFSNLAVVYYQMGQYGQAIQYFNKARELGFVNESLFNALKSIQP